MILFDCPACTKGLRVKPELAGKKVKCPKCGQSVLVPAEAPSPVPAGNSVGGADLPEQKTRAPLEAPASEDRDAPTVPPADSRTVAPVGKDQTNLASKPIVTQNLDSEDDRELTDFLAPPQQPDEIGRLGGYRVLKVLGAGGMGVVYKAEDPSLERLVAVKAMLPAVAASASARKRFVREAKAAAAIKHNHIVTIFQVGEDRGVPFLAMEFLEGEPLDNRLKREGTLPMPDVLRIGREMAEGMAAAHDRGLIHRDIKPANTWLEMRGEGRGVRGENDPSTASLNSLAPRPSHLTPHVKILDFGLARSETDQSHLTQSGAIIGTPAYMAPEQGRGEKLDARCDLWSLGVVLYRMSTGQMPFKGADTVSTLMAVALTNPPAPIEINPAIPVELSQLIMNLLEKDPAKRLGSAHEVAEELRALEQNPKVTQVMAGLSTKAGITERKAAADPFTRVPERDTTVNIRRKNRMPMLLALMGGLVAAIAAAIVFFWPTPDGVIRIEIDDPEIKVVFDKNGPTITGVGKQDIKLTPGEFGLHIQRGDLEFDTDKFILKRGEKITLRIEWFKEGKLQVVQDGKIINELERPAVAGQVPDLKDAILVMNFEKDTFYQKDGNTYVRDLSGKGNDGLCELAEYTTDGRNGGGLAFRHGSLTINRKLLNQLPEYTIAAWVYSEQKNKENFVFFGEGVTGLPNYGIYVHDSHIAANSWNENHLPNFWVNYHGELPKRSQGWEFIAVRLSQGGSGRGKLSVTRDDRTRTGALQMVANQVLAGKTWVRSRGKVDDLVVFSRALTDEELFRLYQKGLPGQPLARAAPLSYQNSLGMEFALVPKGKSWLGGGNGKEGTTEVNMAQDFYLGAYLVTQEEWQKIMGKNPSRFTREKVGKEIGDDELKRFPVETVSWDDVQAFVKLLNEKVKKDGKEAGWEYRLPTEQQWEYACRGGPMADKADSAFDYYFEKPSKTLSKEQANFGRSLNRTCKVGSYPPNRLGLFDIHGNVGEWCEDQFDPKGGPGRVVRGGSLYFDADSCRAASRRGDAPSDRDFHLGFRLARVPSASNESKTFKNSLGMEFALVPRGKSWLGGGAGKEGPAEVNMGQDFYLGVYEVTQEEWQKITGKNPSFFNRERVGKEIDDDELKRFPVEQVSWEEAQAFVKLVNEKLKKDGKEAGWEYRLPTEAQWEYACRGGPMGDRAESAFDFYFEKPTTTLSKEQANFLDSGLKRPKKVGSYPPNRLGLYDMHGNVWEWCEDQFNPGGHDRPFRGGSWPNDAVGCRAAVFYRGAPSYRNSDVGFRLARVPVQASPPLTDAMVHKFEGHTAGVSSVAISRDGKYAVTGSADKTAILWEAAGGEKIHTFEGHTRAVKSVALSGDGKRVLTGSDFETAILWDAASGKKIKTLQAATNGVFGVALSGDGKYALTCSAEPTAKLWEAASGKLIQTFLADKGQVWSVALSGDAKLVLTGANDWKAILWDAASGKKIQTFTPAHEVESVALSSDGAFVLTGSKDNIARLWAVASGKVIQTFQGHAGAVHAVALSGDGKRVLTGSQDKTAILWDAATGKKIQTFQGHAGDVNGVALSGDGKFALTGSDDKTAILWEIKAPPPVAASPLDRLDAKNIPAAERFPWQPKELVAVLGKHQQKHWGWAFMSLSSDGTLVSTSQLGRVGQFRPRSKEILHVAGQPLKVWDANTMMLRSEYSPIPDTPVPGASESLVLIDAETGKVVRTLAKEAGKFSESAFSENGNLLLTGGNWGDDRLRLWQVDDGKELWSNQLNAPMVRAMALSHDARLAISCLAGQKIVRVWDAKTGKELRAFAEAPAAITCLAFSPDASQAVGGAANGQLIFWEVATGKKSAQVDAHGSFINSVCYSRDGRHVLTGSQDSASAIFEVAGGKRVFGSGGTGWGSIHSAAYSADEKRVITCDNRGWVRVWDVASGKEVHQPEGPHGPVEAIAFSADGSRLYTAGPFQATCWNVATGTAQKVMPTERIAAFYPEQQQALTGYADLQLLDMETGKEIRRSEPLKTQWGWGSLQFLAGGQRALSGSDGVLRLWDLATMKEAQVFKGDARGIISGDGRHALTSRTWTGKDYSVGLWEVESDRQLRRFEGHTDLIGAYAFAPDGKQAATAGKDKTIRIWDLFGTAAEPRLVLKEHASEILALAYAPDGKSLLSAGSNGQLIWFDLPSGKKRREWQFPGAIHRVAFAPDGRHIVTGNANGTAYVLRLETPDGQSYPPGPLTQKFTNTLGMEFALVPKGKSWLGGGQGKEGTAEVNIAQDFYLGVYEVTQEEWQKVTGGNPSFFSRARVGKEVGDDELKRFPVENISWETAQAFVKMVNEKVKNDPREAGWEYRLPTEQQWEYACRGGPMTDRAESAFDVYFEKPAKTLSKDQANYEASDLKRPRKVGSYAPNRLGLYDMHGNVWEWCEDQFDKGGEDRVFRGGGWAEGWLSATFRRGFAPSKLIYFLGVRLARVRSAEVNASEGFVSLFNGKDLTGWTVHPNGTGNWKVVEGNLTCAGPQSYLFTQRDDYKDFHFRVEARVNAKGNSGQYFRCEFAPDTPKGYCAQINNSDPGHQDRTGSLMRNPAGKGQGALVRVADALVADNTWFTQEVIVRGNHIQILVNGKKVVDFTDDMFKQGRLALEHYTPQTRVEFRKVEIKELSPTAKAPGPWQPLLDAKLDQWWKSDNKQLGAIAVAELDGEPSLRLKSSAKPAHIATKRWDIKNNHLRLDFQFIGKEAGGFFAAYQWGENGRSGIQFHVVNHGKTHGYFFSARCAEARLERGAIVAKGNIKGPEVSFAAATLNPAGAWNRLDLVRVEDRVAFFINGRFVGALAEIRDLVDGKETELGGTSITLQSYADMLIRRIEVRDISALPPELIAAATPEASTSLPPLDPAWLTTVAAMKGQEQLNAVKAELMKRNLGWAGAWKPVVNQAGVVTEVELSADDVADLSPLRAFPGLWKLSCGGTHAKGGPIGKLADLSPLQGMQLTYLWIPNNKLLSDLVPLKDMKLTRLVVYHTSIADLTPLKGMKLTQLDCGFTRVTNLSPLVGMPLTSLAIDSMDFADLTLLKDMPLTLLSCIGIQDGGAQGKIANLTPLRGMKLTHLRIANQPLIRDLTPLKGMPLTQLIIYHTAVEDLTPLAGMQLTQLNCGYTKVADLSPLKDMPLKNLWCAYRAERDATILRSIKALKTINDEPADKVLKGQPPP